MTALRYGELFAGVSGLGMAVEEVFGAHPAWFAEVDSAPSKVLAYHYPTVPNVGDVTGVDWSADELRVDILAGGFPCQDVSLAGKRRGMKSGTRSGLWAEFARAIDAIRPSWVVIENVRGLLSAGTDSDVEWCPWCLGDTSSEHALRALGAVLGDLADLGFDAEWVSVRASDVGAPHGRFRVFILAWPAVRHSGHDSGGSELRVESEGATGRLGESGQGVAANTGYGFGGQAEPGASGGDYAVGGSDRGRSGSGHDSGAQAASHSEGFGRGVRHAVDHWAPSGYGDASQHSDREGRGDQFVALLLTPVAQPSGNTPEGHLRKKPGREVVTDLAIIAENGLIETGGRLLPTPGAYDGDRGGSQHPDKRRAGGHSVTLQDATEHLMPTPRATRGGSSTEMSYAMGGTRSNDERPQGVVAPSTDWGPYAAAVARWETVINRPAPSPVRYDGKDGKPRLNPELTEWMMGWPEGWVTAPEIGLSRAEQLKACGNGVVTLQAATALRELYARAVSA